MTRASLRASRPIFPILPRAPRSPPARVRRERASARPADTPTHSTRSPARRLPAQTHPQTAREAPSSAAKHAQDAEAPAATRTRAVPDGAGAGGTGGADRARSTVFSAFRNLRRVSRVSPAPAHGDGVAQGRHFQLDVFLPQSAREFKAGDAGLASCQITSLLARPVCARAGLKARRCPHRIHPAPVASLSESPRRDAPSATRSHRWTPSAGRMGCWFQKCPARDPTPPCPRDHAAPAKWPSASAGRVLCTLFIACVCAHAASRLPERLHHISPDVRRAPHPRSPAHFAHARRGRSRQYR